MMQPSQVAAHISDVSTWHPGASAPKLEFQYIDLSAIDQDEKRITASRELLGADAPSRARQLVRAGDVLVSTVRPNLNGVARVPHELDSATASTGFCVLRADEMTLAGEYLFHWVKSQSFVDDMVRKATGASYPAVSDRIVHDSMLPLPRIGEQRRIAAILDLAEALRAKRRQALAKLDTLTQSLFLEMFGDPLSCSPRWPVKNLGSIAVFENGDRSSNYPSGEDLKAAGVIFLNGKNIVDDRLSFEATTYIDESKFQSLSRGKAQNGDLIITLRGTLGSCCIFQSESGKAFINAQMMIIRPSQHLNAAFLHTLLTSSRWKAKFQEMSSGVAVPQLTAAQLRTLPIIVPDKQTQGVFSECLFELNNSRTRILKSLAESEALFASIHALAFRGEL